MRRVADDKSEARALLQSRADAVASLSWEEMDRYGEQEEVVRTPSGRRFRVVTGAFWDMDEWASGMNIYARAYAERGLRKLFPYREWRVRGGPDDLVPDRPGS
jgi:hypothetical protein